MTSSSKVHAHTEPREAPPVYRCGDNHWHFYPNKDEDDILHYPWYLEKKNSPEAGRQAPDERTFAAGLNPIYVKGYGNERFRVDDNLVSGFYHLNYYRDPNQWCKGRNAKPGEYTRKIYREEELSRTPWPSNTRKAPPAYDASPEPPRYAGHACKDNDVDAGPSKT